MATHHSEQHDRISLEGFFALVESDPEHRYEYIDGYPYMMTGGTPDHSIIGANMNRILGEQRTLCPDTSTQRLPNLPLPAV